MLQHKLDAQAFVASAGNICRTLYKSSTFSSGSCGPRPVSHNQSIGRTYLCAHLSFPRQGEHKHKTMAGSFQDGFTDGRSRRPLLLLRTKPAWRLDSFLTLKAKLFNGSLSLLSFLRLSRFRAKNWPSLPIAWRAAFTAIAAAVTVGSSR